MQDLSCESVQFSEPIRLPLHSAGWECAFRSAPNSHCQSMPSARKRSFRRRRRILSKNQETLTILVVEDEPLLRLMIVDFLRSSGCGVVGAASGEAAVEVLQLRDGIDVVFTDIQLGGTL